MSSFRIRPRFRQVLNDDKKVVEETLSNALEASDQFIVTRVPGHLYVKIHPDQQHFWSPQLHLSLEQEENTTIVRGLYGPKPTLWAVFFFGYVSLGILTVFFGMWGLSRWSLGLSSGILWTIPVFALLAAILYFMAQTGQKLGAQQMFDIHHFYEETLGEKIEVG